MLHDESDEYQALGLCAVLYRCSEEFVLRVALADPAASSVTTLERGGGNVSEFPAAPSPAHPPPAGVQALREHIVAEMDAHGVVDADRDLLLQPLAALHPRVGEVELDQVRRLLLAALRLVLHARWYETPVRARQAYCVSRFACGADATSFRVLVPAAFHALEREVQRLDRLWLEQANALQVQDVGRLVADAYCSARRLLRHAVSSTDQAEVRRSRPVARQDSTPAWPQLGSPGNAAASA